MSRARRRGALAPAALVLGAGAAALAPAGPGALAPLRAAAAAVVSVAVVIDFGGGSGAPATVVQCVQVPPNSPQTDAAALAITASQVAYAQSGLLCQIDGYPADGVTNCNATSGQDYYFWSYWHGASGAWVYANNGPGSQPATPGDVEGWRFQDPGPANASAPAPGPAPSYASICPNASNGTTTVPSATAPAPGPVPGVSASATTAPATAGAPAPGASGATPATTTVPRGAPVAGPGTPRAPPVTTTTVAAPGSSTTGVPAVATTSVPSQRAVTRTRGAVAPAVDRRRSSTGAVLPAVLVGVLVLALGLVAAWRSKKRPGTP